jgi:hypothetical protein
MNYLVPLAESVPALAEAELTHCVAHPLEPELWPFGENAAVANGNQKQFSESWGFTESVFAKLRLTLRETVPYSENFTYGGAARSPNANAPGVKIFEQTAQADGRPQFSRTPNQNPATVSLASVVT